MKEPSRMSASKTEPLPHSSQALIDLLYTDLKRVARFERHRVGSPPTLQTTALIHEAYLKLHNSGNWNDRQHFMRAAAQAMRQVLVDAARARLRGKRGGGVAPIPLDDIDVAGETNDESLLQINDALDRLGQLDERLAQVVECRFFAGYDEEETARALAVTSRTVRRDWVKAKAWLYSELNPE
jgi:RNA polymerase sigma factor (TIGR02999 family)